MMDQEKMGQKIFVLYFGNIIVRIHKHIFFHKIIVNRNSFLLGKNGQFLFLVNIGFLLLFYSKVVGGGGGGNRS